MRKRRAIHTAIQLAGDSSTAVMAITATEAIARALRAALSSSGVRATAISPRIPSEPTPTMRSTSRLTAMRWTPPTRE